MPNPANTTGTATLYIPGKAPQIIPLRDIPERNYNKLSEGSKAAKVMNVGDELVRYTGCFYSTYGAFCMAVNDFYEPTKETAYQAEFHLQKLGGTITNWKHRKLPTGPILIVEGITY